MKLATFISDDAPTHERVGLLSGDERLLDLTSAAKAVGQDEHAFSSMQALLEGGHLPSGQAIRDIVAALTDEQRLQASHALDSIQLLAPVPQPASLRDCMSFERHLWQATQTVIGWKSRGMAAVNRWLKKGVGRGLVNVPKVWYERPVYYKGNARSVVGPDTDVFWPAYTERLDFELEFGVFIGLQGKDISADEAKQHIAGYALFNDFSARDVQLREMQGRLGPAKGKDFDTGNSIGPYLVTPDDIDDVKTLQMCVTVNDEVWSECDTSELHYSIPELIAYISRDETLYPGDFIGAGTLPSGCGLELDRWIKPGDVVELSCPQLGALRNRVVRRSSE